MSFLKLRYKHVIEFGSWELWRPGFGTLFTVKFDIGYEIKKLMSFLHLYMCMCILFRNQLNININLVRCVNIDFKTKQRSMNES